ncbi:MAG: dockerin type I domain-containing protein [Pirellulales bacterium]
MMAADVAEAIVDEADASKDVAEFFTMAIPIDESTPEVASELAFTAMLFDESGLSDIDVPIQIKAYSMMGESDQSDETSEFSPEMVMRNFSVDDSIDGVEKEVALFDESEIFATSVWDESSSIDGSIETVTLDSDSIADNPSVIYYMMGSSANDESEAQIQDTSNDTEIQVMNFSTQNRWHNLSFPEDIDGNDIVSPSDVLILINVMNNSGRGAIGGIDLSAASAEQSYLDVNRDTVLSPIDALIVINYINSNPPGTELNNEDSDANIQASLFAPEIGRLAIVTGDEKIDIGEEGSELWFTNAGSDTAEVVNVDSSASRMAYTLISEDATETESTRLVDSVFEKDLSELLAI